LRYCTKDTEGYIREINRLKDKYARDIQIYLGAEEDASSFVDRSKYDYIIGSSHYFFAGGKYYPIDSGIDCFNRCLELFNYDAISLANSYYSSICDYICRRKPDIIGHFDLITKFDEKAEESLFLKNDEYNKLAKGFAQKAISADCIFEINTGAISRGYRTTPYPNENILHLLAKSDARITLTSASH
jgi:histidinol-phosphatase (PHP family)